MLIEDKTKQREGDHGSAGEQPQLVALRDIMVHEQFQSRDRLDPSWVRQLMEIMEDGPQAITPILCFRITHGPGCAPGLLYLVGGFYRYQAAQALGWSHIRTIVREGTRSDALDAAAADNAGALQKPRRPVMREVKEMTMRTIVAGRS